MRLKNFPMRDGARQFAELHAAASPEALCLHLERLDSLTITEKLLSPYWDDSWIDFSYLGNDFDINLHWSDYWFFAKSPACPEEILASIVDHCRSILPATSWMLDGPANPAEVAERKRYDDLSMWSRDIPLRDWMGDG